MGYSRTFVVGTSFSILQHSLTSKAHVRFDSSHSKYTGENAPVDQFSGHIFSNFFENQLKFTRILQISLHNFQSGDHGEICVEI